MSAPQASPDLMLSKFHSGLADAAECQKEDNFAPETAALDLDVSVLSSLLSVTASTLMRTQPLAFREALEIECARLLAIAEIDPSHQGRLVANLLAEWVESL